MADPSAALRATSPAADDQAGPRLIGPAAIASGEPLEDVPPAVELIGFDEPVVSPASDQRPPRRRFLRPPALDAAPEEMTPLEIPALIEPTAERAPPRESLGRRIARRRLFWRPSWPPMKMLAAGLPARRQRDAPEVELPAWRKPRARVIAVCAIAVAVVIAVAAVSARIGPFTSSSLPIHASLPPPNNPADRLAYYQKAADAGDADAQLQLAILYAKGERVAQDYAAAAKWFRAAADRGSARAQYDLGVLHERGRGVSVDLVEAAKWYLKAAEGKYPLAQFNLAVCYTKGQGVRKDLAEAALWYRRAALQGVVQGMVNLGTMYERGDGVPVSPVDAYAWYLAAARRGNEVGAKRSEEIFAALPKLDQIRAEALASDVAGSIHDFHQPGAPSPTSPETPAATAR